MLRGVQLDLEQLLVHGGGEGGVPLEQAERHEGGQPRRGGGRHLGAGEAGSKVIIQDGRSLKIAIYSLDRTVISKYLVHFNLHKMRYCNTSTY